LPRSVFINRAGAHLVHSSRSMETEGVLAGYGPYADSLVVIFCSRGRR
jgi:hypothetical protein